MATYASQVQKASLSHPQSVKHPTPGLHNSPPSSDNPPHPAHPPPCQVSPTALYRPYSAKHLIPTGVPFSKSSLLSPVTIKSSAYLIKFTFGKYGFPLMVFLWYFSFCIIVIKPYVASYANEPISHRQPLPSNAQAGQFLLWSNSAFSAGRFAMYACPL